MGKYLVIFVLSSLCLAYILNPSIPDGIQERWKYRLLGGSFNVFHIIGSVCGFYGMVTGADPGSSGIAGAQAGLHLLLDWDITEYLAPGVSRTEGNFSGTKVYIYQPSYKTDLQLVPGFVYFHGGGLMLASAHLYDGIARKISFQLNAVVINVEYRTTPENKFPGPVNEAFAAVKWFMEHAGDYGVDPNRIAVGGDSAGGYLSAVMSFLVYDDQSLPNLKLQILIYPWTQCLDFNFPSYQKYYKEFGKGEGCVCRHAMAEFCASHAWGSVEPELIERLMENRHTSPSFKKSTLYKESLGHQLLPSIYRDKSYYKGPTPSDIGDENFWNGSKDIFLDPRFTPHFRKNLTGLPPAFVVTVGFDTLRDEGRIYAQQLKEAGVEVTAVHYEKGWHGIHWISPLYVFQLGEKIHHDFLAFTKAHL